MTELAMTLDEFSERYIKPAMQRIADMTPEELIEAAEQQLEFASFYDAVLSVYGIDRRSAND